VKGRKDMQGKAFSLAGSLSGDEVWAEEGNSVMQAEGENIRESAQRHADAREQCDEYAIGSFRKRGGTCGW